MTVQSEARQRRGSFSSRASRSGNEKADGFEPEPFDEWLERTTKELGQKVRLSAKPAPRRLKPKTRCKTKMKPAVESLGGPLRSTSTAHLATRRAANDVGAEASPS